MDMNLKLKCLNCSQPLIQKENSFICGSCKQIYSIKNGIVDFSPIVTNNMLYQQINLQFSSSLIGKKTRFMNFGLSYMPCGEDNNRVKQQKINRNSVRLLEYVFQNISLKNKTVVDVGCGRGGLLLYCHNRDSSVNYIGVDSCIEGLQVITKNRNDMLLCADACNLPLNNDIADIIICIEAFHAFADKRGFISECQRILRYGGTMILIDIFYEEFKDEFIKLLLNSDFLIINCEDLTNNVLQSIREISDNRMSALSNNVAQEIIGAPGTMLYNLMSDGGIKYYYMCIEKSNLNKKI